MFEIFGLKLLVDSLLDNISDLTVATVAICYRCFTLSFGMLFSEKAVHSLLHEKTSG